MINNPRLQTLQHHLRGRMGTAIESRKPAQEQKRIEAEVLAAQVAQFVKSGGEIKLIPVGVTGQDIETGSTKKNLISRDTIRRGQRGGAHA